MESVRLDEGAAEVAAMQFAGGMSIARVADLWEQDPEWVEDAVRRALLGSIPRRDGGTKASRIEARMQRQSMHESGPEQLVLECGGVER